MAQSPEIAIHKLVKQIRTNENISNDVIKASIKKIIELYVTDFSKCSNITFNSFLADELIELSNLQELRDSDSTDYTIRKCIREIIQMYLDEEKRNFKIEIKDESQFEFQMKSIGINLGFTQNSTNRSLTPDGNVLVLAVTVLLSLVIVRFMSAKKG